MPTPQDELQVDLWTIAALGRLARQGLLETPAPASDPLGVAAQQLLLRAGLLDADPLRPSAVLDQMVPPGAPLTVLSDAVHDLLALVCRFADGAPGGWVVADRSRLLERGPSASRAVVGLLALALREVPEISARLDLPGAAFLDTTVGMTTGHLLLALGAEHPSLRLVAMEPDAVAAEVATERVVAAGLAARVAIRQQSVEDAEDVDAFDLVWLHQPVLPPSALAAALPRVRRALRRGGLVVMPLATDVDGGLVGAAADVRHLMVGGGTLSGDAAARMLVDAGFDSVRALDVGGSVLTLARRS